MYQDQMFPPAVAILVGQVSFRAGFGWSVTVAARVQEDGAGFGQWTTYGPMTACELATLLEALV